MKKKRRVVDIVEELASPLCESIGIELVDVAFVKEGPHRYLRLTIDKDGGISLNDCEKVSRLLNDELDRVDPIEENYYLEVTSPGVERELKRDVDFEKFAGKMVQAKLYQAINSQKLIEGNLVGLRDGYIIIDSKDEQIAIPREKASVVKLLVKFDD